MQLGLFNSQPEKTDINLSYVSVISHINKSDKDASYSFNLEDFIETEKINLGEHQGNNYILKNKKQKIDGVSVCSILQR